MKEYQDLMEVISFEGFNFDNYYYDEEKILKPRLEALGYSSIRFHTGERDSFGPLSRVCMAMKNGTVYRFVYL